MTENHAHSSFSRWQGLAAALSVLALALWALALPAWMLRLALLRPVFYQQVFRQSDVGAWLPLALASEWLERVPPVAWPPWIPRDPGALQACLQDALAAPAVEFLIVQQGPAWAHWAVEDVAASPPPLLAVALQRQFHSPQGERLRECFWAALPACPPPASESLPGEPSSASDALAAIPHSPFPMLNSQAPCLPADPADWPAVGLAQRAWWETFTADAVEWLAEQQRQWMVALPPRLAWTRWMWVPPVAALALTALAVALASGRSRWWMAATPLLGAGVFALTLGAAGFLDLFNPWSVLPVAVAPAWLISLWPPLWSAMSREVGLLLLIAGALSLTAGLVGAFLATEGRAARTGLLLLAALALGGAYAVLPLSALAPLAPLPGLASFLTPTPWPTLTSTPTVTPTVPYWPVTPGTPWPTPAGDLNARAEARGCFTAPEPALALHAGEDALWVIGAQRAYRYDAARLLPVRENAHPLPVTLATFHPSGAEVALIGEEGVHFYALPTWERALWSRVRTLSRSEAAVYVTGAEQLALGLDNGYLWVIRTSTGGIAWLLKSHAVPVTALAAHPSKPWVLSGGADGSLQLWDLATGASLGELVGHTEAVSAVAFSVDGAGAVSADVGGLLTLWDVAHLQMVQQRQLEDGDAITAWAVTPTGIVGGAESGALVWGASDMRLEVVPLFAQPITALARTPQGALFVAAADGQVCVLTTLDFGF